MKKEIEKIIGTFLLFLPLWMNAQQDAQYSQYMFNQLSINPAYAGSREALVLGFSNRDQWVNMPGSPKTLSLFLHGPLRSKKIGLGGQIITESMGPSGSFGMYSQFAYRIFLNRGTLSLGISAGLLGYGMNLNKLEYKEAEAEAFLKGSGSSGAADFSTGFYYYTSSFYIGGAITHLSRPGLFSYGAGTPLHLKRHHFIYLGKAWMINEYIIFNPTLMFKQVESSSLPSTDISLNFFLQHKLWLGLSLRQKYGIVFLTQYIINEKFKIGYSYDYGMNRIGNKNASHELMLSFDFKVKKPRLISPRYL